MHEMYNITDMCHENYNAKRSSSAFEQNGRGYGGFWDFLLCILGRSDILSRT